MVRLTAFASGPTLLKIASERLPRGRRGLTRDRRRGSLPGGLECHLRETRPAKQGERALGKMVRGKAADGHELGVYRAEPAGAPRGAVVVAQEIFGVNSHIRAVCDDYAKEGYLTVAPALFDRVERDVQLGYTSDDIARGRALREPISLDERARRHGGGR